MLRTRQKYQLSSGSLVVADKTQQNQLDYTQQNRDWAALESFKSNLWVLIVKKVVLSNQNNTGVSFVLATKLFKNAGLPNLSLAPLRFFYNSNLSFFKAYSKELIENVSTKLSEGQQIQHFWTSNHSLLLLLYKYPFEIFG